MLLPATLLAAVALGAGGPASGVCPMKVHGVQGGRLTAGVNISEASSTAAAKGDCGEIKRVVRALVSSGAEMPQKVRGFRCTPTVRGRKVSWTCTYRGGRPRTTVEADFAYRLAS